MATGLPDGLAGRRLVDLATGTGTVAIEAAKRGAAVTGVDLTDELLEVAQRRAADAGVDVIYKTGDFDHLGDCLHDEVFDVITSSFGVIFAPDAKTTLGRLHPFLVPSGVFSVAAWDPDGVFMVPESMLSLMPERPAMPDMTLWTTRIEELCSDAGWTVSSVDVNELHIPFESVEDAAVQLEAWSGGFGSLFEMFDRAGDGELARSRFEEHLANFAGPNTEGVSLKATYYTSGLRPPDADV